MLKIKRTHPTDTICKCVEMAYAMITLMTSNLLSDPLKISVTQQIMVHLGKYLQGCRGDLMDRAEEFRGHYSLPPEPWGGVSAASYHEIGFKLAQQVYYGILQNSSYRNCLKLLKNRETYEHDYNAIRKNWPRIHKYFQNDAPRFDGEALVARILDEATRANRRITASNADAWNGGGSMTVDEANQVAMELAKQDANFINGVVREWAAAIRKVTGKTCSNSTVQETPFRKATMKATGRGRTKGKAPKAVTLTDSMEAVIGEGERSEVLQKLIAEQEADYEPSSLNDTQPTIHPKQKQYKSV